MAPAVVVATLLLVAIAPIMAQQSPSCKETNLCSIGKLSPFTGDIFSSEQFLKALEARSYNKELIVLASSPLRFEAAIQAVQAWRKLGMEHILVLSTREDDCQQISRFTPGIGCAWSSDYTTFVADMGYHMYLWNFRYRTAARAVRLGYNVYLSDGDVINLQEPYKFLKKAPFNDFQFINMMESQSVAGTGFLYVQNARPDGPAAWLLSEIVDRPLRMADESWQFAREKNVRPNCVMNDHEAFNDALIDAAAGRPLFLGTLEHCSESGMREDSSWQHAVAALRTAAAFESRWQSRSAELDGDAADVAGAKSAELRWLDIRVPSVGPRGWRRELGGAWYPSERGNLSATFLHQLQSDCPDCPLWPDPSNASLHAAAAALGTERFLAAPAWLASSWHERGRRGLWLPRASPKGPQQVVAHIHFIPRADSAIAKRSVAQALGMYDYVAGANVSKGGMPYWSARRNPAGSEPPRVLALTPNADLSRISSWDDYQRLMQGLTQAAVLAGRSVAWVSLPCAAWMMEDGAAGADGVPPPGTAWQLPLRFRAEVLAHGPLDALRCSLTWTAHRPCLEAGRGLLPWELEHLLKDQPLNSPGEHNTVKLAGKGGAAGAGQPGGGDQLPGQASQPADGAQMPGQAGQPVDGAQLPGEAGQAADGVQVPGQTDKPADGAQLPAQAGQPDGGAQPVGQAGAEVTLQSREPSDTMQPAAPGLTTGQAQGQAVALGQVVAQGQIPTQTTALGQVVAQDQTPGQVAVLGQAVGQGQTTGEAAVVGQSEGQDQKPGQVAALEQVVGQEQTSGQAGVPVQAVGQDPTERQAAFVGQAVGQDKTPGQVEVRAQAVGHDQTAGQTAAIVGQVVGQDQTPGQAAVSVQAVGQDQTPGQPAVLGQDQTQGLMAAPGLTEGQEPTQGQTISARAPGQDQLQSQSAGQPQGQVRTGLDSFGAGAASALNQQVVSLATDAAGQAGGAAWPTGLDAGHTIEPVGGQAGGTAAAAWPTGLGAAQAGQQPLAGPAAGGLTVWGEPDTSTTASLASKMAALGGGLMREDSGLTLGGVGGFAASAKGQEAGQQAGVGGAAVVAVPGHEAGAQHGESETVGQAVGASQPAVPAGQELGSLSQAAQAGQAVAAAGQGDATAAGSAGDAGAAAQAPPGQVVQLPGDMQPGGQVGEVGAIVQKPVNVADDTTAQQPGSQAGDATAQQPGSQAGNATNQQTGSEAGDATAQQPGSQAGGSTAQNEGSQAGDASAQQLGSQDGDTTAQQPGSQAGDATAQQPGSQADNATAQQPGGQTGDTTAQQPGSQPGDSTSQQLGSQAADATAQQPGGQAGEATAQQPGSQAGDATAQQPGGQAGDATTQQPGDQVGDTTAQQPGSQASNATAQQPGSRDGDAVAQQPGEQAGGATAQQPGSQAGDDIAQQTGSQAGDATAQQPGSQAGDTTAQQPGHQADDATAQQPDSQAGDATTQQPSSQAGDVIAQQTSSQAGDAITQQMGSQAGDATAQQPGRAAGDAIAPQPGSQAGDATAPQQGSQAGDATAQQPGSQAGDATAQQPGSQAGDATAQQPGSQAGDATAPQQGSQAGDATAQQPGSQASNGGGGDGADGHDAAREGGDDPDGAAKAGDTDDSHQHEAAAVDAADVQRARVSSRWFRHLLAATAQVVERAGGRRRDGGGKAGAKGGSAQAAAAKAVAEVVKAMSGKETGGQVSMDGTGGTFGGGRLRGGKAHLPALKSRRQRGNGKGRAKRKSGASRALMQHDAASFVDALVEVNASKLKQQLEAFSGQQVVYVDAPLAVHFGNTEGVEQLTYESFAAQCEVIGSERLSIGKV